ncbi:MAG: hypothetical protein U0599_13330 [Vicinamibacteria bacterium]
MNAITVRNLPPAVAKAVEEKARRDKLSLNKAIVRLLEEATGEASRRTLHHDLDHLAGSWSEEDERRLLEGQKEHRRIDPEMWK